MPSGEKGHCSLWVIDDLYLNSPRSHKGVDCINLKSMRLDLGRVALRSELIDTMVVFCIPNGPEWKPVD